ncbi:MAG: hypothetical protein E7596_07435 [Ruminococcaceae bacterium]|nr:hypothetical protein [Oscillospiraceae bacterium]
MKRLFAILLATTLLLCLFSCGESTFDSVASQLDSKAWLSSSVYESWQIDEVEESIRRAGIEINGEVENIAHYIKADYPQNTFVYVYEFELSDDAQKFKEQYADNWSSAKIKDNVVIYGTATAAIEDLSL